MADQVFLLQRKGHEARIYLVNIFYRKAVCSYTDNFVKERFWNQKIFSNLKLSSSLKSKHIICNALSTPIV